tara:strand:+ start:3006 stop:3593 length:588 start_codon:yes stop_codon:yes gene_type:complete
MILISHRVNKIKELIKLNPKYGVEIDIRDSGKDLIIVHDPFKKGVKLNDYLKNYKHSFIIANIKSERIEEEVIKIFNKFKIKNYFFLDTSFPQIINLIKKKYTKIALRVSYYEGLDTAKKLNKKINWIWYDTFLGIPNNINDFKILKRSGYKICLVSPELHNLSLHKNSNILKKLKKKKLIDAVCTKEKYFKNWI